MSVSPHIAYRHTQHAPLCLVVYFFGILMIVSAWLTRNETPQPFLALILSVVGTLMLVIAASFHYLRVEDEGDWLSIRFGPLPFFQRRVQYDQIVSVETGQTTWPDGLGIHLSAKGGWVWNLWGSRCAIIRMKKGTLRLGSDAPGELVSYLQGRMPQS
ncbi:MAG: hypothetical protein EXS05_18520 [Planctomycetaceae bacterium]|nr:hypothetical protein [Planctomycetaceae bacterium]